MAFKSLHWWHEDGTQHHDSQDLPDAGAPEEADEASFCTISCSLLSPPAVETWARVTCTQQPHPRSLLTLQLQSAMSHRVRQALAHFRLQQATWWWQPPFGRIPMSRGGKNSGGRAWLAWSHSFLFQKCGSELGARSGSSLSNLQHGHCTCLQFSTVTISACGPWPVAGSMQPSLAEKVPRPDSESQCSHPAINVMTAWKHWWSVLWHVLGFATQALLCSLQVWL